MDNLNWEVQGLDVKNRKLWEQNPGTGEHVDHEVELESARTDVAEMAAQVRTLEQQQEDRTGVAAEAEHRATEAEERATGLLQRVDELSAVHQQDQTITTDGTTDGAVVAELEEALGVSEGWVQELEADLSQAEERREVPAQTEVEHEWTEFECY